MKNNKHLLAALLVLTLIGAAIYAVGFFSHSEDVVATVEKNGEVLYRFNLAEITDTRTYTVGEADASNEITVSPDGICVSRADCPDQTCVKQGVRAHGPAPIVCLPHALTIRFSEAGEGALDATTGQ